MASAWERGQGFPRDENMCPRESSATYERFLYYLNLPTKNERRTFTAVAKQFNVTLPTTGEMAGRFRWKERAAAFDAHNLAAALLVSADRMEEPLPERLERYAAKAAQTPKPSPKSADAEAPAQAQAQTGPQEVESMALSAELIERREVISELEREHERMLEEFRSQSEKLGRSQMQLARAMTGIVSHSVQTLLAERRTLDSRTIPGFVQSACTLAAAAHQNWGRAIGVDRLLLTMERAVAESEQQTIQEAEVSEVTAA